jgi:hypothetical protein
LPNGLSFDREIPERAFKRSEANDLAIEPKAEAVAAPLQARAGDDSRESHFGQARLYRDD